MDASFTKGSTLAVSTGTAVVPMLSLLQQRAKRLSLYNIRTLQRDKVYALNGRMLVPAIAVHSPGLPQMFYMPPSPPGGRAR